MHRKDRSIMEEEAGDVGRCFIGHTSDFILIAIHVIKEFSVEE